MQAASAQPGAVLNYAATRPQEAALRRLRKVVVILIWMLLLGVAGYLIQPSIYRTNALLQIQPPPGGDAQLQATDQVQAQQGLVVAGLTSAANINAAVTSLNGQGIPVNAALVTTNLKAKPVAQSRLVLVQSEATTPGDAAAIANAVISSCRAPGITTVAAPAVPAAPQRSYLYPIVGVVIGFFLGFAIVALRWR